MKKVFVLVLLVAVTALCFAGCNSKPDLEGVPQSELTYTNIGYSKSNGWDHAQGLTFDGTNFYFAGHNDKTNESADIHIIDGSTMQDVGTLAKIGVMHGAEVEYNTYRDTLFVCSGGNNRTPSVREINKTTGESLNYWDFEGLGRNGGALVALGGLEDTIILFTSADDGAKISFSAIELKDNGEYEVYTTIGFSNTDLGVPQGLDIYNDSIYYLADAGKTTSKNPHYIYKISIENDDVTIEAAYSLDFPNETEGLCITDDGTVYFGDAEENIYKIDKNINEW